MITRRVHKISGISNHGHIGGRGLEEKIMKELAPAERIVGTQYIDGYWWIITESFGLGPIKKPGGL